MEFLEDLASVVGPDEVVESDSYETASAWIEVLALRRAIEALKGLELHRGDVVATIASTGESNQSSPEIVSSIREDGVVYFRGGGGQREHAHRLHVLARAVDHSEEAEQLRVEARNRVAKRSQMSGSHSPSRFAHLLPFKVEKRAGRTEALMLTHILDSAMDERPLQRALSEDPSILASLVRSTLGTYVVPLPRFGSQYIPDFAICATDSAGPQWTLIELESPTATLSTNEGRPAEALRKAVSQIEDWREWLEGNLDYARKVENGLGLTGIRSNAAALVLIGVAAEHPQAFESKRHRMQREQQITVHTYSWLVNVLNTWDYPLHSPVEYYDEFMKSGG